MRGRSLVVATAEAYNLRGLKALQGSKKDAPHAAARRPKEYVEAVEEVSREIQDPVAKLRFLRTSLRDYPRVSQVEGVPSGSACRMLYRWASFEHLRALSAAEPADAFAPAAQRKTLVTRVAAALTLFLAAGRLMMGLAALVVVFAVGSAAYRHARPSAAPRMRARGSGSGDCGCASQTARGRSKRCGEPPRSVPATVCATFWRRPLRWSRRSRTRRSQRAAVRAVPVCPPGSSAEHVHRAGHDQPERDQ